MTVPKPKKCGENWMAMTPALDGRICNVCHKKIYDFRKKSWSEIEKIHLTSSQPVCGTYNEKQLDYWATTVENRGWNSLKYALTLAGILSARIGSAQSNSSAREKNLELNQQQNIPVSTPHIDTIKSKFLKGKIYSKEDGSALPGVNVFIKNTSDGTVTNAIGEFNLKLEGSPERTNLTLVFSFIGLKTIEKPLRIEYWTQSDLIIQMETDYDSVNFYVTKPTFFQRVKYRVKRLFTPNKI